MKTKYYFLAGLAAMMLASCSSDDFIAEAPPVNNAEELSPIMFSSLSKGMTRADFTGKDAADKLGNKFVVSGYKGAETANVGSIVFDNYLVKYYENTANTTESNSDNWEYVGETPIAHATANGITSQTIKYWDYSKAQYDFFAWSTGDKTAIFSGTPTTGQVLVSAITPSTATGATGTAYTFKGKAVDLTNCYISDLVTVNKTGTSGYGEVTGYNQPVTLKFRALGAKVRIGIYETIPGYSVKDVKFYTAANVALATDGTEYTPTLFTTTANDIFTEGTYTIYFPTVDTPANADNNQAHIRFAGTGTQSTVVNFGDLEYVIAEEGEKTAGASFLGRSSNTASMAGEAEGNYYTQYLPNESGTNLNLRVNYTLEAIDGSGEEIVVQGATAQVPSIYTQWKAGYAYTYLFKISDKTNGYTGVYDPTEPDDVTVNSDPAGLYPITFDAVVVNAEEDATQETITTVSAPSITTYQEGSTVVNNNEYEAVGPIYVTVNDGATENTPDLAHGSVQVLTGKAALYTISDGKTEAEVVDALQLQDDDAATGTIKGRNGVVLNDVSTDLVLTNKVKYGVDGNAITVGAAKVGRFTPTDATTYAFVYTKSQPKIYTDKFQPVTKAADDDVAGLYRYDYTTAGTGDVQKGVTYFAEDASHNKISHEAFLGQTVNNLYTATHTLASGFAVTGTQYYYTLDHGLTYLAAAQCAYADFATTELYTFDGSTYTAKTETKPADNTAYYTKVGSTYTYCVIYPEQEDNLFILDETAAKVACTSGEKAITGQVYFDKYTQNDGVYYTKVIKVQ